MSTEELKFEENEVPKDEPVVVGPKCYSCHRPYDESEFRGTYKSGAAIYQSLPRYFV